jgi:hypothetical protein
MTDNLDTVKSRPATVRAYHHGALRQALIDAAEAVIAERGLDRFSLRSYCWSRGRCLREGC